MVPSAAGGVAAGAAAGAADPMVAASARMIAKIFMLLENLLLLVRISMGLKRVWVEGRVVDVDDEGATVKWLSEREV